VTPLVPTASPMRYTVVRDYKRCAPSSLSALMAWCFVWWGWPLSFSSRYVFASQSPFFSLKSFSFQMKKAYSNASQHPYHHQEIEDDLELISGDS